MYLVSFASQCPAKRGIGEADYSRPCYERKQRLTIPSEPGRACGVQHPLLHHTVGKKVKMKVLASQSCPTLRPHGL